MACDLLSVIVHKEQEGYMRRNLSVLLCVVLTIVNMYVPVYATELSETERFSSEEVLQNENSFAESMDETITDDIKSEDAGDVEEFKESIVLHDVYEGDGFKVYFDVTDSWSGGYNALIKIENISDQNIDNWMMTFEYDGEISNIWNANISSHDGNRYTVKNAGWNQDIEPGQNVEFGISGQEDYQGVPGEYKIIGTIQENDENEYDVIYKVESDWGSGFTASVAITSHSAETIEDWILEFDYDRNITNIWNAEIVEHEGNHYVLKNKGYNANIAKNQTINIGFNGNGGSKEDVFVGIILRSSVEYAGDSMEIDTDGDGIVDGLETLYGLDYRKVDTDGDGLTDYEEIYLTMTDPLKIDTDGNGINDPNDDLDIDGLSNKEELDYGTSPISADTDKDDITDYDELYKYVTDPLVADTDGDGLTDGDDVVLGFNPLLKDTDGNGIIDSEEKVLQSIEKVFGDEEGRGISKVEVTLSIQGNIEKEVGIINVYDFDKQSSDIMGLIGIPVQINSKVDFDSATIRFTYDENLLGDNDESDISILWYDEANNWYQILDRESVIDIENNTVELTTTHFSTYMLVNSSTWFDAWRENIDYRSSSQGSSSGQAPNYFDIAFVVDTSGSMGGTRIANAKTAINSFIDALQEADSAAIVKFDSVATVVTSFTEDKTVLKSGVSNLYASGNTNANAGIVKATSLFNNRDESRQRAIVLICDGDVYYYKNTIDTCKAMGIKIYAINLMYASSHTAMQRMASDTGGQYYYGASAAELGAKLVEVQNVTIDYINPTDTDEDGLYDIYETAGMKLPNGRVVYTQINKKDTDEDGLTDFEETGLVYNVDDRYIGKNQVRTIKYFMMRSNPTKKDTDYDLIEDKDDSLPWNNDFQTKYLSGKLGYLEILDELGNKIADGGNQGWWYWSKEDINYYDWVLRDDYKIGKAGCGLIAASDFEVFFMSNYGYSPSNGANNPLTSGKIKKNDYMNYVNDNFRYTYDLSNLYPDYKINITTLEIVSGLQQFLKQNNSQISTIKWAPLINGRGDDNYFLLIDTIEGMIENNIPVVASIHSTFNPIVFYTSSDKARNRNVISNVDYDYSSHFFTIIGVEKYIEQNALKPSYILVIESWGSIYYIRYDDYIDNLNYFSNILKMQ